MAVTKYLDKTGLSHFWSKIKAWANSLFALDSAVVHKTGNETVAGNKTFTGYVTLNKSASGLALKNTDISKGTKPSSICYYGIPWTDTNGISVENRLGLVETSIDTDGNTNVYFRAYKNASGSSANVSMGVCYDYGASSGYTFAPTPATNDNSTKIATTAFVKAQGYLTSHQTLPTLSLTTSGSGNAITALSVSNHAITATKGSTFLTSHQSLANYVTLNSAQTISAVKTFTAKPVLNQVGLDMTVKDTNADTLRTYQVLHANSDNTGYGLNVAFGGSGNTVVGGGESLTTQLNALAGDANENLYLVADGHIYFKTNGQTFANAKTITLDNTAHLYGLTKVTATSFVGSLTGNVTGNCSGSSGSCTGNAATATKLATARSISAGDLEFQGSANFDGSGNIKLNITQHRSIVTVGNANNYPFHRIAYTAVETGNYTDRAITFFIGKEYISTGYGICRIILRTNNASGGNIAQCEVQWLVRTSSIPVDAIQVGFNNTAAASYIDVFYKSSGAYNSAICRVMSHANSRNSVAQGFIVVSASTEVNNTTASDPLTSTESYATIAAAGTKIRGKAYTSTITASDSGVVSSANSCSGNAVTVSGTAGTSTLAWNSEVTLYTVGGHAIKAKLPANPNTNTDTLMTQNVSTTNATYPLLAVATADATANLGAKTAIFGSGVKINPSDSKLIANYFIANGMDGIRFRQAGSNKYTSLIRNDGSSTYLLLTNVNDPDGTWNSFRPLTINNSTGVCNISGNSATATKFASAQSVTLTGAITGTVSSQAGWSVNTIWRSCMVGQSSSTNTKPWYKVATCVVDSDYAVYNITFLVEDTYYVHDSVGILKIHIRTEDTPVISIESTELFWVCATANIVNNLDHYVLVCPTTASPTVELWTKIPYGYQHKRFTVLTEGTRTSTETKWTLLNASTAGQAASITTSGTQIVSKLRGVASSCTGNAATATELATARSLWGNSFDGSTAISGSIIISAAAGKVVTKNSNIIRNTAPSSNQWNQGLCFQDKNGVAFGGIEHGYFTDKTNRLSLIVYKGTTTDTSTNVQINVGYDKDGNWYTYAPTPATADNSSKIATTAFVKAQGYLTSHQTLPTLSLTTSGSGNAITSLSVSNHTITATKGTTFLTSHQSLANYVTLNSSQTITGSKMFNWFGLKNDTIDRTLADTTTDHWYIAGCYHDKNGHSLIDLGFHRKEDRNWSLRLYDASGTQHWMMFQGINHDGTSPYVSVGGDFYTMDNGNKYCGLSTRRWKAIYAVNGAIQTSDERIKEDIDKLPEAVLDAWESIEWLQFRMKPSIEKKGNSARLHSGIIAQRAKDAFSSVGLDASDYGFFCWDQWNKTPAMFDEKGNIAFPEMPAGDQYSIRYDEALAIEAAYQRRKNKILEKRISDLEEQLSSVLEILNNLKGA